MTINEVKDTMEPLGHVLTLERRIAHGTQLGYRPRILVDVYDTGTYVIRRDTSGVREALERMQTMRDQGRGIIPKNLPHPRRVSVSGVKEVLSHAGYSVKRSQRLIDESGTKITVVGGAIVVVYDKGLFQVQGTHTGWVKVLLNEAFRNA